MNTDASWPTAELAKARVLRIQTKLHQRATDDPDRRFDDLYNLVYDPGACEHSSSACLPFSAPRGGFGLDQPGRYAAFLFSAVHNIRL